jgi:Ca2+-binding EF-hand superfamily protein
MYDKIDYQNLRKVLCVDKTPEGIQKRKKLFKDFDPNGNGFLSLAEVDKGIRDVLKLDDIFAVKRVIMRAFQASKNICRNKSKYSDDYIEINEFRIFLVYLRQYFEYFEMFQIINTDGDRKLSYKEFQTAVPKMEKWGIKITDPKKVFAEIDLDKGGFIMFDEFCHWAIKNQLDIDTDDDFEDEALSKMK